MPDQDQVVGELRKLQRLVAVGLLEGSQRDKIRQLSAAHFSAKEIAETLGIGLSHVTSDLSKMKKATKQG